MGDKKRSFLIQSASTQRTLSSAINAKKKQRKPFISSFRNQKRISSAISNKKRIFSFRESSSSRVGYNREPSFELKSKISRLNEIRRIENYQKKVNEFHSEYGDNAFMTLYEAKEELLEQGEKLRDRIIKAKSNFKSTKREKFDKSEFDYVKLKDMD